MKVIVYQNDTGGVAIIWPTPEGIETLGSVEAVADKDVPTGKPYTIIEHTDLPADRSQRNAWTVAPALLTDGVGA